MLTQYFSFIIFSIVILVSIFSFFSFSIEENKNFAAESVPPKTQKIVSKISSILRTGTPGVYWYQLDDGSFNADHSNGKTTNTPMIGSCKVPLPQKTAIPDEVDLAKWPPTEWKKYKDDTVLTDWVKNIKLESVLFHPQGTFEKVGEPIITSTTKAKIETKTGGDLNYSMYDVFMNRPFGDCSKVTVGYDTPVDIIWQGDLIEEKEIEVDPDSVLQVDDTKQLKASIRTKSIGSDTWGNYIDITSRTDELKWWSSDESIATVNPTTGLVTAVSEGKVTIRAIWKKDEYLISDTADVIVGEGGARIAIDLPNEICMTDTSPIQAEATLTKMDKSTYNLQSHPSLSWTSSDSSVATIGKNGVLTPTGTIGSTEITAHFVDTEQALDVQDTFTVHVVDCNGQEEPDAGVICTIPAVSNTLHPAYVDPTPSGVIKADKRDQETFDVAQGIPTSEDLYGNVLSREYLYDATFTQMTGTCDFKVPVTKVYHRKWDAGKYKERSNGNRYWDSDWKSDDKKVTKNYTITRPYSYWTIPSLAMYQLS